MTVRSGHRRWTRHVVTVLGVVLLLLGTAAAWLYVPNPDRGPLVVVSVDDSTWNALGLNRLTYVRRLRQQGLRTVLVSRDATPSQAGDRLESADGLVLTGGGDVDARRYGGDPERALDVELWRDELELALLANAERLGLPVLGLCRGAQLVNVRRGGTLGAFRDEPARYRRHRNLLRGHPVTIAPDSRLAEIYGSERLERITTWHGQYVAEPGRDVRITAHAPDGTPEAIEVGAGPEFGVIGVQWHAEMPPWDDAQAPLFRAFSDAAHSRHTVTKAPNRRR